MFIDFLFQTSLGWTWFLSLYLKRNSHLNKHLVPYHHKTSNVGQGKWFCQLNLSDYRMINFKLPQQLYVHTLPLTNTLFQLETTTYKLASIFQTILISYPANIHTWEAWLVTHTSQLLISWWYSISTTLI